MELVKNRASGKFFVVLDDAGGPDFLLITPEGKIKRLERRLFSPQSVADTAKNLFKRRSTRSRNC